eukprot:Phypoly_transcript_14190.p1 GENE.Phypoly_transcript_14190~~Phypoly_transcript_14190.p1  ORF type:complete len:278 (+),score=52.88 Phypoly_transcript_14190:68-835(+)
MKKIIQIAQSFNNMLAHQVTVMEYQKADLITDIHTLQQEKILLQEQENKFTLRLSSLQYQIAELQTEINHLQQERKRKEPIAHQILITPTPNNTPDAQTSFRTFRQKIPKNTQTTPNNTQDDQSTPTSSQKVYNSQSEQVIQNKALHPTNATNNITLDGQITTNNIQSPVLNSQGEKTARNNLHDGQITTNNTQPTIFNSQGEKITRNNSHDGQTTITTSTVNSQGERITPPQEDKTHLLVTEAIRRLHAIEERG